MAQLHVWLAALLVSPLTAQRPNFLIAVSDDQSYPYASAYGCPGIRTPAFDRVAAAGVLFTNAYTPAPGCSPMRAAFLTGRHIWQIEHAGTHASSFPKKYLSFQDALEASGYAVGFTGKGWGPGNWKISGRPRNPAGTAFQKRKNKAPKGIRSTDYAANFQDFLGTRKADQPFSFWFGASEPHRGFARGIGQRNGRKLDEAHVPAFLPDTPEVRGDILDYCYEIEWFDRHLGRMLDHLKATGELENTFVIVTSDNGMAFPRAKANLYDHGIHMPLAVAWPKRIRGGRRATGLVDLLDLTATIYAAADLTAPKTYPLAGMSLLAALTTEGAVVTTPRSAAFSGRERHSSSRFRTLGYPQRSIRQGPHLLIRNFRPERWPAGTPRKLRNPQDTKLGPPHGGYHDIDGCPTLQFLIRQRDDPKLGRFLQLATARRPAIELFDIEQDPACLDNLAAKRPAVTKRLHDELLAYLEKTRDPRVVDPDKGDVFKTYPRYSGLRWFPTPDWARKNPGLVPDQPWLEKRRPK